MAFAFGQFENAVGGCRGFEELGVAVGPAHLDVLELRLQLGGRRQLVLLGLRLCPQRVGLLLQRGEILFQPLEAVFRGRIAFLLQRFLLDLRPYDFAVEIIEALPACIDLHAQARRLRSMALSGRKRSVM